MRRQMECVVPAGVIQAPDVPGTYVGRCGSINSGEHIHKVRQVWASSFGDLCNRAMLGTALPGDRVEGWQRGMIFVIGTLADMPFVGDLFKEIRSHAENHAQQARCGERTDRWGAANEALAARNAQATGLQVSDSGLTDAGRRLAEALMNQSGKEIRNSTCRNEIKVFSARHQLRRACICFGLAGGVATVAMLALVGATGGGLVIALAIGAVFAGIVAYVINDFHGLAKVRHGTLQLKAQEAQAKTSFLELADEVYRLLSGADDEQAGDREHVKGTLKALGMDDAALDLSRYCRDSLPPPDQTQNFDLVAIAFRETLRICLQGKCAEAAPPA